MEFVGHPTRTRNELSRLDVAGRFGHVNGPFSAWTPRCGSGSDRSASFHSSERVVQVETSTAADLAFGANPSRDSIRVSAVTGASLIGSHRATGGGARRRPRRDGPHNGLDVLRNLDVLRAKIES